ncbi:MAG: AMP-binding protein [Lentisphaeria bacterium]|nr:AMP-binding protein [Lentisphaeria bacterium]
MSSESCCPRTASALKIGNWSLDIPEYCNCAYDVIDRFAREDKNKLAMIWVNQEGAEKRFTFADLSRLSNQAANMLMAQGIKQGDRVFLLLPRIPEWWIFSAALMKIGAIACPAPTLLMPHDIQFRINYGGFNAVIADKSGADKVDEVSSECPKLEYKIMVEGSRNGWVDYYKDVKDSAYSTESVDGPAVKTRAKDPMLLIFTSGTSKNPKLVQHTFDYPYGHLVTGGLWHGLREGDLHFAVSDTGWGKNVWSNYFGQWMMGACLFIYDIRGKFHAEELLHLIEKYQITSFCAPPTIYRMLVLNDLKKFNFKSLRSCTAAGEPLHAETCRIWCEGTGITIREGYGQTETASLIATFADTPQKVGSMGKAAPNWHIELHDDDGVEVPQGEIGRIAVKISDGFRPVGLLDKYIGADDDNSSYFVNGYYYTGDKARVDEEGYYWFCGRNDDIIKSSGYRIGPLEVEEIIMRHESVQEVAIVGAPDAVRGVVIKAYIVLKSGFNGSDELVKDIQHFVREETAPYKYPRLVEFVKALPKSFSGKVKREILRKHAENGGELVID